VARLDALPGLRLRGLSRWYLTDPMPPSCQPAYINAVAVLRVEAAAKEPAPDVLLAWLQAIESDAGRYRSVPNAPRTLDLDIIAMGNRGEIVRMAPDPVLPHPRAHLRAFVLVPLRDVVPDWVHPVLLRRPAELLAVLPVQDVRPL
jgi:2-amino-4-hydroxy-6-hydroxymethyldihydropteridine diphosphokinase